MTASTIRQVIDTADDVRELKARVSDLEEAILDLRRQVIILREAAYAIAEGEIPTLAGVGR